jgi:hypothetical protein
MYLKYRLKYSQRNFFYTRGYEIIEEVGNKFGTNLQIYIYIVQFKYYYLQCELYTEQINVQEKNSLKERDIRKIEKHCNLPTNILELKTVNVNTMFVIYHDTNYTNIPE